MSKKSDDKLNDNQPVDLGRRGIAKAGVVAPVLMTLSSKSAFGLGRECTPSNLASGNLSSPVDELTCDFGCTHGYWKNHDWDGTGYSTSQTFCSVFYGADSGCPFEEDATLQQVVEGSAAADTNHLRNLGVQTVAALLNAAHGSVPYNTSGYPLGMTTDEVITLFRDAITDGDLESTKDDFDTWNNNGCPLN